MSIAESSRFALVEFLVFFSTLAVCILLKVDSRQNKPYMDEIFHIPQAQQYCNGNFRDWDPMITTLPGLYISSILIIHPVSWIFDKTVSAICSTFCLRFINIGFATGNTVLFYLLLRKLTFQNDKDSYRCLLSTAALSFFPLLYFFTFLYYTDSGSTFFVLLMYYSCLHGKHKISALCATAGILFRQTNIVWVIFMAGISVENNIIAWIQPDKKDISPKRIQEFNFITYVVKRILRFLKNDPKQVWNLIKSCINDIWPYVMVVLGFISFVVINGSIVVGAKDDHQASLHFPQIFYFLAFTTGFSFMYQVTFPKIKQFLSALRKHFLLIALLIVVSVLLIWKFTFVHKYTLADNRHYPFYVWRRVYALQPLVRYALVPFYIYGGWSLLDSLQKKSSLWKLVYMICTCVNLIPQVLLEFRYFILPYLIFRLNIKTASYTQLILELILYVCINAATLYLFMEKPFTWPNSPDLQRFMW